MKPDELYNEILLCFPHQRRTSNLELDSWGSMLPRFLGAFNHDKMPKMKIGQSCILNTGNHWIAVYKSKVDEYVCYDSFGRRGQDLVPASFIAKEVRNSDDDSEQAKHETSCGQRSLSFLFVLYKLGVEEALSL